jgi:hypothetical protein
MKFLLCFLITLTACTVPRLNSDSERAVFGDVISEDDFFRILKNNTRSVKAYNGLDNVFQFKATVMTKEVLEAQARRNSFYYQWSPEYLRQVLDEEITKSAKSTRVFVSFFTPDVKHNDLNRAKSMWEMYLSFSGARFSGKATKLTDPTAKIQAIFPSHDGWSIPYVVEFSSSTSQVSEVPTDFVITGSLGSGKVTFNTSAD